MLVTINVTQDDIDHGEHFMCHSCMLGSAIQRVLKSGYFPRVETTSVPGSLFEGDRGTIKSKDNYHISFSIKRNDSTVYQALLPEEAGKMADKWEHDFSPENFRDHPELKVAPFIFQVEIPKEYLK